MELEQLMARPQATIYCINLPDYSLPGFVSGDKPYFGTLADIDLMCEAQRKELRALFSSDRLRECTVLGWTTYRREGYKACHSNTYGFPYYMSCSELHSNHLWIQMGNNYYRCVRAGCFDLRYSPDEQEQPGKLIGGYWGFPHQIRCENTMTYCQMFVVEKTFANASEAVQDITGFTGEALLSEFVNDIFGDG